LGLHRHSTAIDIQENAMPSIRIPAVLVCLLASAGTAFAGQNPPEYTGPTPYLSIADSPIGAPGLGLCYEDFEDGTFDIPGATGNGSIVGPAGNIDSVDGDDGPIDGSGNGGTSYFSGNGSTGITIEFDPLRNEGLPHNVGIVWTDGGGAAPVTFEAFDKDGQSIQKAVWGPFVHADLSNNGETAEDRYYGAFHPDGISKITISNTTGGIEVDHIQLDHCFFCGDTNFDSEIKASDALTALRASVGSGLCVECVCDTNASGDTSSSDALAILRKSVGLPATMNCAECGVIV
jgi:hypothetical protein